MTVAVMKAAVLNAPGEAMQLEEIPVPEPRHGEVLLRVEACGVCHTDLHVMQGDVDFPTPAVLGHEVAGRIVAVGPGVSEIAAGTEVVTSFIMPCGSCRFCSAGRDDLCARFFAMNRLKGTLYDGSTRLHRSDGTDLAMYSMGGLAELAVVPVSAVFPRPASLPASEAAVLGCAFFTAYGAVRHTADLHAGERVAVVAVGGVGTSIIQVARAFGASQVIAVDIQEAKLQLAQANGATHVVDASGADPVESVRELSEGGVDVAFEALGTPATFVQAVEMVRDGGRMVAVGIGAKGAAASVEITRVVRRVISIRGSYGGRARADMPEVVRLAELGHIRPGSLVTRTYPLADVAAAYAALAAGEIAGRAVVVPETPA